MRAFVVRLDAGNVHPHQLVGFYVARSKENLCQMIDECCDAQSCEVMEIGPGGISWAGSTEMIVPYPEQELELMPDLPAGASPSGTWSDVFAGITEGEWEPGDWIDLIGLPEFANDN